MSSSSAGDLTDGGKREVQDTGTSLEGNGIALNLKVRNVGF